MFAEMTDRRSQSGSEATGAGWKGTQEVVVSTVIDRAVTEVKPGLGDSVPCLVSTYYLPAPLSRLNCAAGAPAPRSYL